MTEKLNKGEITIKAEEKSQQFGQTSCHFDISAELKSSPSKAFFTLAKQESETVFRPFFKSECKKLLKGKYSWKTVLTNSDLLANDKDESRVEVSMYEYSSSGKHKNVGKFYFDYKELKSNDG